MPAGTYSYDAAIYYQDSWLGNVPPTMESQVRVAQKSGGAPWVSYPAGTANTVENILSASALTEGGLLTGSRPECTGAPAAPVILSTAIPVPLCNGDTVFIAARDPNTTAGIS